MDQYSLILQELNKFSDEVIDKGNSIKHDLIKNFIDKIGYRLPNDFIDFQLKHNGFSLMGTSVYPFSEVENTESIDSVYYIEHNEVVNPQFQYLVPFSTDGGGNFYCLDLKTLSKDQDTCNVVFWQSEYEYSDDDIPEIVAESFLDWVQENIIDWTLEDYDYEGNGK